MNPMHVAVAFIFVFAVAVGIGFNIGTHETNRQWKSKVDTLIALRERKL